MAVNPNPPLRQTAVSPDAAVLTANGCVLPGRLHVHVVQRGLPHHMMSPRKLQALLRLSPREQKKKYVFAPTSHSEDDDEKESDILFSHHFLLTDQQLILAFHRLTSCDGVQFIGGDGSVSHFMLHKGSTQKQTSHDVT